MFANLNTADFRVRSQTERRAAERERVHALFDAIQVAIHARDRATVDDLMAELGFDGVLIGGPDIEEVLTHQRPHMTADHRGRVQA
jgi:hypothetical protein